MLFVCCFVYFYKLYFFKINYLILLVCFKCICIIKYMLNFVRNEIFLIRFLNLCYYYLGRKVVKYFIDSYMLGYRYGVVFYKEDFCGGLG